MFGRRFASKLVVGTVGVGALVVFTFPNWSDGSVRPEPQGSEFAEPKARMRLPNLPDVDEALPKMVIETKKHTLTLSVPGASPVVMKASGAYTLKPGTYRVGLKKNNPVWQAPPTYFQRRGLPVPAEGSPARLIRALGDKAIYFDKQLAIHSGPVWNAEVGGLKIASADMTRLFDVVREGATIEVR